MANDADDVDVLLSESRYEWMIMRDSSFRTAPAGRDRGDVRATRAHPGYLQSVTLPSQSQAAAQRVQDNYTTGLLGGLGNGGPAPAAPYQNMSTTAGVGPVARDPSFGVPAFQSVHPPPAWSFSLEQMEFKARSALAAHARPVASPVKSPIRAPQEEDAHLSPAQVDMRAFVTKQGKPATISVVQRAGPAAEGPHDPFASATGHPKGSGASSAFAKGDGAQANVAGGGLPSANNSAEDKALDDQKANFAELSKNQRSVLRQPSFSRFVPWARQRHAPVDAAAMQGEVEKVLAAAGLSNESIHGTAEASSPETALTTKGARGSAGSTFGASAGKARSSGKGRAGKGNKVDAASKRRDGLSTTSTSTGTSEEPVPASERVDHIRKATSARRGQRTGVDSRRPPHEVTAVPVAPSNLLNRIPTDFSFGGNGLSGFDVDVVGAPLPPLATPVVPAVQALAPEEAPMLAYQTELGPKKEMSETLAGLQSMSFDGLMSQNDLRAAVLAPEWAGGSFTGGSATHQ